MSKPQSPKEAEIKSKADDVIARRLGGLAAKFESVATQDHPSPSVNSARSPSNGRAPSVLRSFSIPVEEDDDSRLNGDHEGEGDPMPSIRYGTLPEVPSLDSTRKGPKPLFRVATDETGTRASNASAAQSKPTSSRYNTPNRGERRSPAAGLSSPSEGRYWAPVVKSEPLRHRTPERLERMYEDGKLKQEMRKTLEEEAKKVIPKECTFRPRMEADISKARQRTLFGSVQGWEGYSIAERGELWRQQVESKREALLREREERRLREEEEEKKKFAKESKAFRKLIAKVSNAPRIRLDPQALGSASKPPSAGNSLGPGGSLNASYTDDLSALMPSPRKKGFFKPMDEAAYVQRSPPVQPRGSAFTSPVKGVIQSPSALQQFTPAAAPRARTPPRTPANPQQVQQVVAAEQRSVQKFLERQEKARAAKEEAERQANALGKKWRNTPTKPIEPQIGNRDRVRDQLKALDRPVTREVLVRRLASAAHSTAHSDQEPPHSARYDPAAPAFSPDPDFGQGDAGAAYEDDEPLPRDPPASSSRPHSTITTPRRDQAIRDQPLKSPFVVPSFEGEAGSEYEQGPRGPIYAQVSPISPGLPDQQH